MSKSKPFVAVDSDTLLYSAVAACESRTIEVLHSPTGKSKEFKNRTEFKAVMKSKEKEITSDYCIIDRQEPEPVENALHLIKQRAEKILDNFQGCEVVFCAGDNNNFRAALPYPTKYKGNRDNTLRPLLLKDAHEYFRKKYKAVRAEGNEVDDEIAILAYGALEQGREAIVLSPDGDSRQFDGLKLGSYHSDLCSCVSIDFWHDMKWIDGEFDSYGFPWMMMQGIVGDATDGLNPSYLAKKRFGEKGFFNEFGRLKTPEDMVVKFIEKYQQWYPSEFTYTTWDGKEVKADWKFMLNLYWKGTTMKRKRNEEPDFWQFLKEKGVQL